MSEVRRDIVTDTWVIVETDRPDFIPGAEREPRRPPACPFCAGNEAMTPPEICAVRPAPGEPWLVRVVPDRHPVLRIEGRLDRVGVGIHDMVTGIGANEVVIEAPEHQTAFAALAETQVGLVLRTWRDRLTDLCRDQRFRYVLIFKDHGALAGGSTIEHVHSQVIALPATPRRVKDQLAGARDYFEYKERCIFCDILQDELRARRRVLLETDRFAVFAPYASRLPFELRVMPRRHCFSFAEAGDDELDDLARALRRVMAALDRALAAPPYNLVLHTAPNLLPKQGYWQTIREDYHWFLEIIPRVRRTDGFEWGSGFFINPVPPELAAEKLSEAL
ncbi:MAG: galactose-1-phosphate uridylyltransferase [bacterium]